MNNEEKHKKVEEETRRVMSEIDKALEKTRISSEDNLFFDENIYLMTTNLCLKGVVEAYNSTLKNTFPTGTRRQKKECLRSYKKVFETVFP